MAENGKIGSRTCLRKALFTVVALAAVCGLVLAMRRGAQFLVVSSGIGEDDGLPAATPSFAPAPREYDLDRLVPEELRHNAGGLVMQRKVELMRMPYDQALEVSRAQAEAAGWEVIEPPLVTAFARIFVGGVLYVRPDRVFVSRTHIAQKNGATRREDLLIPIGDLDVAGRDVTLDEILALRGDLFAQRLPPVIRDVLPGRLFYTQFTPHRAGSGFLVVVSAAADVFQARAELLRRLAAHGWTRDDAGAPGTWRRSNLTVSYDVCARDDAPGSSFVSLRFADDDALVPRDDAEVCW